MRQYNKLHIFFIFYFPSIHSLLPRFLQSPPSTLYQEVELRRPSSTISTPAGRSSSAVTAWAETRPSPRTVSTTRTATCWLPAPARRTRWHRLSGSRPTHARPATLSAPPHRSSLMSSRSHLNVSQLVKKLTRFGFKPFFFKSKAFTCESPFISKIFFLNGLFQFVILFMTT